jgi:hypothetical protein
LTHQTRPLVAAIEKIELTASAVKGRISRTETIPMGRESTMDYETRNEFEQFCALAEIEQDLDKFLEIKRNLIRILDEKEVRLKSPAACK